MSFEDLTKAIADAHATLAASLRAELPRRARIAIWKALGPYELARDANGKPGGAVKTVGLRRRYALADQCVQRVLPIWERVVGTRDSHEMRVVAADHLAGRISWEAAWKKQNAFGGGLDNAGDLPEASFHAAYAGYAAQHLVLVTLADEDMEDPQMSDEEFDGTHWDSALTSCAAEAGDVPWGKNWEAARGGAFWTWYLNEAVPRAWDSVPRREM